eukprot:CAMPEP_0198118900 /NCGR_PEP_ID=MMETSP1442-20131203/23496_1 /TAXON_ID= /ORGANISM="Craspedostauros australis, Strain CCMP3328" /LENGTH=85 /DNA_ID=CAMNT_0043777247 /DNA_START=189 /DNA_END=446 /DNA_ORIENTATION=+
MWNGSCDIIPIPDALYWKEARYHDGTTNASAKGEPPNPSPALDDHSLLFLSSSGTSSIHSQMSISDQDAQSQTNALNGIVCMRLE